MMEESWINHGGIINKIPCVIFLDSVFVTLKKTIAYLLLIQK